MNGRTWRSDTTASAASLRRMKSGPSARKASGGKVTSGSTIGTGGSGKGRPRRSPIAPPLQLPKEEEKEKEQEQPMTTTMCAKWERLSGLISPSGSDVGYKVPESKLAGHDAGGLLSTRLITELASERRALNAVRSRDMKRARLSAEKVCDGLRVPAYRDAVRSIAEHYAALGSKETARAFRSIPRRHAIHLEPGMHAEFIALYTDLYSNTYDKVDVMLRNKNERAVLRPNSAVLDARADDATKRVEMLAGYFEALQKARRQMKQIHEFHIEGDVDTHIQRDIESDSESDSDIDTNIDGCIDIDIDCEDERDV